MSYTTFFTTQTASTGIPNGISGKIPAGGTNLQGLSFVDLILAQMLKNAETATQGKGEEQKLIDPDKHVLLESNNPLLTKTPGLKLAEILAANQDIREAVEHYITDPGAGLSLQEQILQTLSLNQGAMDNAIAPLTDGVITTQNIENGSPRLLNTLIADNTGDQGEIIKHVLKRLQKILEKFSSITEENGGELTLVNLTPAQISGIQEKIADLLTKDKNDLFTLDIKDIIPAKDEQEAVAILQEIINLLPAAPEVATVQAQQPQAKSGISSPKLKSGGYAAASSTGLPPDGSPLASPSGTPSKADDGSEKFDNLLKNFSSGNSSADNKASTVSGQISPQQNPLTLQNFPTGLSDTLTAFDSVLKASDDADGYTPLFSVSTLSNLTNLVTNAPSAAAPHPASQMVAAAIQRNAESGFDKSIMIQLDPPDLGRVEIRLSFNRDKAIKAVVLAERGETLGMLQRDAHVLERALQNVGLDGDGAISFELAGDNHFGHDGSGGHGDGKDAEESENIIQSTMTWYVDAATGHTHYSILA